MDAIRQIARTVLYEGYILWPYRRSAVKNQQRWTFGGVYPRAYSETSGTNDAWQVQSECLLEAPEGARVEVSVRFLQLVQRQVARINPSGLDPVDELVIQGERHLTWQEATEREEVSETILGGHDSCTTIRILAGTQEEDLFGPRGERAGVIQRSWETLEGTIECRTERASPGVFRVTVRASNTTPFRADKRAAAVARAFLSTHFVLSTSEGGFVSSTDPPDPLRAAANSCRNSGLWPVLIGDENDGRTMLCSPIILYDHPRIAPESPGDLFDGTEIDQLLILNILALSDAEKEEMKATDPRAREILERVSGLSPQELMRLHGAIRGPRPPG